MGLSRSCEAYVLYSNSTPSLTGAHSRTVTARDCFQGTSLFNPGGWFAVAVWDASGVLSPLSQWIEATPRLGAPASIAASDGDFLDRIVVRWSGVANANLYRLTRTPLGGGSTIIETSETFYEDTAAAPGERVDYSVTGLNTGANLVGAS